MSELSEFVEEPGFSIVPASDLALSPEDRIDAAVAALLDDPFAVEAERPPVIPFGRSWQFDRQRNRFVRSGVAPVEVRGFASLEEWIMNALTTAAGRHPIFSPEFGIEDPYELMGVIDVGEAISDFEEKAREALLYHPRIAEVDDLESQFDPTTGVVWIQSLSVVTDEAEAVELANVPLAQEIA